MKKAEKQREGYTAVPFDDPYYGVKSFGTTASPAPAPASAPAIKPTVYRCSHLTPISEGDLKRYLAAPAYAISEKVNGERCLVAFDGTTLRSFNRKGQESSPVPPAALALRQLACRFVIDGERIAPSKDNPADIGQYVAFDLLEWQGRDVMNLAYSDRIALLETGLRERGLVPYGTPACAPLPGLGDDPRGLTPLAGET